MLTSLFQIELVSAARQNIDPCQVLESDLEDWFQKCLDSRSTRISGSQMTFDNISNTQSSNQIIFSAAKAIVAHSTHFGRWLFISPNRRRIFSDITTLTSKN